MIRVLALTDEFSDPAAKSQVRRASQLAAKIQEEYRRLYYSGVVSEREARALLHRGA